MLKTITDHDLKIILFRGDQKSRLVFSDDPQMVQDRGRIEFTISTGNGLVTRSVV